MYVLLILLGFILTGCVRPRRIRVGTFNVNGRAPTSSVASWVRRQVSPEATNKDTGGPDVLIFGFEEVDLSTGALLYSTSTVLEEAWTQIILASLGEHAHSYVKVSKLPVDRLRSNLITSLLQGN
jgi:hypothetical protein